MSHLSGAALSSSNSSPGSNESRNAAESDEGEPALRPPSMIVLLAFICLLIVIVNGVVIFLAVKNRTLKSLTNMFLTSLALSDLISGLLGFPLLLFCSNGGVIIICVASTIFFRFTAISSVCHVLLIALDRYVAIVHPLNHETIVRKWRAITATAFIWLFSLAASVVQLSWYSLDESSLSEYEETEDFDVKYTKACIVLFFAIPFILMCYIYSRIFYISFKLARRDHQLTGSLQNESRSVLHEWRGRSVLFIMVVIFAGCWLPFFLAMLGDHMESAHLSHSPVWVQRLLVVLNFTPPLLNPILCTLAKKDFRKALSEMVFRKKGHQNNQERFYSQRSTATDL